VEQQIKIVRAKQATIPNAAVLTTAVTTAAIPTAPLSGRSWGWNLYHTGPESEQQKKSGITSSGAQPRKFSSHENMIFRSYSLQKRKLERG